MADPPPSPPPPPRQDQPAAAPVGIPLRAGRRSPPSAASSAPSGPRSNPQKSIDQYAEEWAERKAASGASEEERSLPFLTHAPKKVECLICSKSILPAEKIQCLVHHCEVRLHKACAKERDGFCPRHICFYCKKGISQHRVQRTMPSCTNCLLQQNRMIDSVDPSKTWISWRNWPLSSEEAFGRLPLPYADKEFDIDPIKKEDLENGTEPPPYVHLKRNVYLVKNKSIHTGVSEGCTDCDSASTCKSSCSCRSSLVSCSQACRCSNKCTNKPFLREKKIEVVKTKHCGWGVRALEDIEKGDFVIEYVGEVIDDERCKERLEDMKKRGDKNFYLCKVGNDFIIDSTFRGNACRFINHSCNPNCQLEKWHVNGKTRLRIVALDFIAEGEPLTYNYRFSPFGSRSIKCLCGAPNCQGYL